MGHTRSFARSGARARAREVRSIFGSTGAEPPSNSVKDHGFQYLFASASFVSADCFKCHLGGMIFFFSKKNKRNPALCIPTSVQLDPESSV